MNGGQVQADVNLGAPPNSWHIDAVGDFNGDGTSDILWRNDSGAVGIWEMHNGAVQSYVNLSSPPTSWHIVAHQYDFV